MSRYVEPLRVPFTGTNPAGPTPEKQSWTLIPPPTNFSLGTVPSDKYCSSGNPQIQSHPLDFTAFNLKKKRKKKKKQLSVVINGNCLPCEVLLHTLSCFPGTQVLGPQAGPKTIGQKYELLHMEIWIFFWLFSDLKITLSCNIHFPSSKMAISMDISFCISYHDSTCFIAALLDSCSHSGHGRNVILLLIW